MKLSVHLVTWNGSKYIPFLFDSLKKQTFKDFKLITLDNASSDDTVAKIENGLKDVQFEYELIVNQENKGFAGGHNQLNNELRIKNYECEYFLIINQDLYLMPDCIEKLVKYLDENSQVAAVAPRTMRWQFSKLQVTRYKIQDTFSNTIDSLGLKIYRNRRVVEIGEGEDWDEFKKTKKQENKKADDNAEVFGVSGAIILFRKKAIDEVGFLDESYQSYKEDVDLAYRINSAGWQSAVLYEAVTYHDRTGSGVKDKSDSASLKNKQIQKPWVKYHSYKNHLMTIYKNEYWQNFILDLPWILWYELKKFGYFLVFDINILVGLKEIWKMRKELKDKRCEIKDKRKIRWREMRKWWNKS